MKKLTLILLLGLASALASCAVHSETASGEDSYDNAPAGGNAPGFNGGQGQWQR